MGAIVRLSTPATAPGERFVHSVTDGPSGKAPHDIGEVVIFINRGARSFEAQPTFQICLSHQDFHLPL